MRTIILRDGSPLLNFGCRFTHRINILVPHILDKSQKPRNFEIIVRAHTCADSKECRMKENAATVEECSKWEGFVVRKQLNFHFVSYYSLLLL